jgi:arylsulfatase A-like enzyme
VVLALTAACRREAPGVMDLQPAVAAGPAAVKAAGFSFPAGAETAPVTVDLERRPAVLLPPVEWSWHGRVPPSGRLYVGAQWAPEPAVNRGLEIVIRLAESAATAIVASARSTGTGWLDFTADLRRFAGREITLAFAVDSSSVPAGARVAWSDVRFEDPATDPRPNLVLIVVDTLRADHLTSYGYERPTGLAIDRLLARQGAVFDAAYSQAPWTLPSVASFLTSRYPGELVGGELGSFGIPAGVPTLAERLRAAGYETAGFVANPTLHPGNGFDRGFDTFYTPPASVDSMLRHGDDLVRRVLPWLRGRGGRPFFLYVHFIDPHDPYENPETSGGRSVFFPEYRGTIGGRFVHGIYNGRIALPDPPNDVRQVAALYDSEIHYVDGRIGELLQSIPAATMARTLLTLTSDHGEELHDHGGWKHGQTLYQEQIHVPWIVRWDGQVAPGTRLGGAVRLLDLLPTLLAAAGAPADPADEGVDLLAALRGRAALPRLPVIAEHLASGPRRAAAILEGRKLVLFDRRAPFIPADALQDHLYRVDLARLRRVEVYDLAGDGGEHDDLAGRDGGTLEALQPLIHHRLDRELPGLRLLASGLPAGSILDGTIRFERPPARWTPYFLGEGDAMELVGSRLRFRLRGDALVKGALVEGELGAIVELEARLDGATPASVRLLVGRGAYAGGRVDAAALLSPQAPAPPDGPALRVWISERGMTGKHAEEDPETVKRLQALGYIQR